MEILSKKGRGATHLSGGTTDLRSAGWSKRILMGDPIRNRDWGMSINVDGRDAIDDWLVVTGCHFLDFPIYWECHHPKWRSYFSEGWLNHQPDEILDINWSILNDFTCFLSQFPSPKARLSEFPLQVLDCRDGGSDGPPIHWSLMHHSMYYAYIKYDIMPQMY